MKLLIENICKIAHADIRLDGLTVITGSNNTGKSTVGKTLWAMFNALTNLQDKITAERIDRCTKVLAGYSPDMFFSRRNLTSISSKLVNHEMSVSETLDFLSEAQKKRRLAEWDTSERKLVQKGLEELLSVDDDELRRQIVRKSFNSVFSGQFSPMTGGSGIPAVKMTIQNRMVSVSFDQTMPSVSTELDLKNSAFLFDSPDLLESDAHDYIRSIQRRSITQSFLQDKAGDQTALDSIITEKRFDQIQTRISDTIGGSIVYDDMLGFRFSSSAWSDTLNLGNLSQGIKAMGLLQAAFSHGTIQDGDLLILDEPEIHLHPVWQLLYAELIVLLQKAFHLTVLLTTHSPDFAQAIRLYAQRHQTADTLAAYLAEENDKGTATFRPLPQDNWDEVFTQFAISFDRLMELQRELEDRNHG